MSTQNLSNRYYRTGKLIQYRNARIAIIKFRDQISKEKGNNYRSNVLSRKYNKLSMDQILNRRKTTINYCTC